LFSFNHISSFSPSLFPQTLSLSSSLSHSQSRAGSARRAARGLLLTAPGRRERGRARGSGGAGRRGVDTGVGGCGASYEIGVVSEKFEGKRLLERHRMENTALAPRMAEIHAVSIKKAWVREGGVARARSRGWRIWHTGLRHWSIPPGRRRWRTPPGGGAGGPASGERFIFP
ncbi:unnamed protein product, partial [Urochloa humidicola]